MQLVVVVVVSKTYVAVFACWNPSAGITLHHRRIATPVLEKYYLLSALKGLLHLCQQRRREWLLHHLAAQQILHIYHLYVRQQHITIPLIQANIAILLDSRIIETLKETIGQTPERIVSRMKSSVREFTGDAEQNDDLTMLAVQYYVK